ncbi:MAG TPA: hypothetical protein VJ770_00305 [Stellaceae bacterium]|nr:hypothetical protein [Stellaceae bacterium]
MYISLADSLAKGFRRWADAHQPDNKIDDHASGGDAVNTADLDADGAVLTPPERAHRPWLVPGEGRL